MSTQNNPHLVVTVKCAGPGCANIRRESNHWFLITLEPEIFICRPFSSTINLQDDDKPVCGQACAQKLLECFLAKPASSSPRQQSGHSDQSVSHSASSSPRQQSGPLDQSISRTASPSPRQQSGHSDQSVSRSASPSSHHQLSQPDQPADRHRINSVIDLPTPEDNMNTHAPTHSQPTPPINEQSADPISNQYVVAARLSQPELISCVYIGLQCSQCGDVRQALNDLPADETTFCPQCGTPCCFARLGTGLTSRELPFHEITSPPRQHVTPFHHAPEVALHPRPWQEA